VTSATIVGLQWGDEGKGKVLDALAGEADMVVRYQGGGNAGHTVIVDGVKYVFHLVPTGVLHPGVVCVIGNGTVIDPVALRGELDRLHQAGHKVELRISDRAHLVLPYHQELDTAREEARSKGTIGTTKRGIGPCYADKASRTGIRVADLFDGSFEERLKRNLEEKNAILCHLYRRPPLPYEPIRDACLKAAEALEPHVADTGGLIQEALAAGKRVLFEGAQGAMLDLDHGTYPFVTSSSASPAGVPAGAGVPPSAVGQVLGVAKAYTTRVGAGPFPTELHDEPGERLRQLGHEFGATTGRPRRCGWLDLVQLEAAIRLGGVNGLVLTKLDTLAGYGPLRVAVAYERGGQRLTRPPATGYDEVTPIYEDLPALPDDGSIPGADSYEALPEPAREYVEFVERRLGVPVVCISTGPERRALLRRSGWKVYDPAP
jgi:adenylosuccinate synthase